MVSIFADWPMFGLGYNFCQIQQLFEVIGPAVPINCVHLDASNDHWEWEDNTWGWGMRWIYLLTSKPATSSNGNS